MVAPEPVPPDFSPYYCLIYVASLSYLSPLDVASMLQKLFASVRRAKLSSSVATWLELTLLGGGTFRALSGQPQPGTPTTSPDPQTRRRWWVGAPCSVVCVPIAVARLHIFVAKSNQGDKDSNNFDKGNINKQRGYLN